MHTPATNFSTRTDFIDLKRGSVITDLEKFAVTKDGHRFYAIDENFWGVTWAADSDTFYATMRTGTHYYLIRGHLQSRKAEILTDGVECPTLSPDGTRVVYKHRIDHGYFDPATWQLHVLDLNTLADHALSETQNVDDQAAWIDNTHVAYTVAQPTGDETDTWSVATDNTAPAQLLVPNAESPVPPTP